MTEVVGAGGRVFATYTDGLFHRVCGKCGGDGLYHGYTPWTDEKGRPYCFACSGCGVTGKGYTEAEALKAAERAEKAAERAAVKREAQRVARFEAGRAAREAEEAAEAARAAARAAKLAEFQWVGTEGEQVAFEGEVVFQKGFDTRFGRNWVHVVREGTVEVKFFSTARWVMAAEVGDRVHFTATVKEHETYEGKKATLVARAKGVVTQKKQEVSA